MWRLYPVAGYYGTRWLTGLWFTQANVEGMVLKAAWHWGSDSSVFNDPLREAGRTPFYVGLPSAWVSVDDDYMFSPHFVRGLRFGDSDRYKRMNGASLSTETLLAEHRGGLHYRGL